MGESYYHYRDRGAIGFDRAPEREKGSAITEADIGTSIDEGLGVLAWQNYQKRLALRQFDSAHALLAEDLKRYKNKTHQLRLLKEGAEVDESGSPISYATLGIAEHLPLRMDSYNRDLENLKRSLLRSPIEIVSEKQEHETLPQFDDFNGWTQFLGEKLYQHFIQDAENRQAFYEEYQTILWKHKAIALARMSRDERKSIIARDILPAFRELNRKMDQKIRERSNKE